MRDPRIDTLKGLAIVLVVLGHILESTSNASFRNMISWNVIYSFHIPLFAFVSGYLIWGKKVGLLFIKKRFIGLMLPYVSWLGIEYAVLGSHKGLWFLLFLFISCCIFTVAAMSGEDSIILLSAIIVCPLGLFMPLRNLAWIYPFLAGGYLFAKHHMFFQRFRKPMIPISLTIYLLSLLLVWPMMEHNVRWWYRFIPYAEYLRYGLRYACAFGAVVFLGSIIQPRFLFSWIGQKTIGIYAVHGLVTTLLIWLGLIDRVGILLGFVAVVLLSALITVVIDRTFLRMPLLGKS